jgi:hypothetical protein
MGWTSDVSFYKEAEAAQKKTGLAEIPQGSQEFTFDNLEYHRCLLFQSVAFLCFEKH